jgi:hypothetical protein
MSDELDVSQPLIINLTHLASSPAGAIASFGKEWAGRCAQSALSRIAALEAENAELRKGVLLFENGRFILDLQMANQKISELETKLHDIETNYVLCHPVPALITNHVSSAEHDVPIGACYYRPRQDPKEPQT